MQSETQVKLYLLGEYIPVPYSVARHIMQWTSVLDEHGNKLDEPVTRTYAELDTSHIHNIVRHLYKNTSHAANKQLRGTLQTVVLLNEELAYRGFARDSETEQSQKSFAKALVDISARFKIYDWPLK